MRLLSVDYLLSDRAAIVSGLRLAPCIGTIYLKSLCYLVMLEYFAPKTCCKSRNYLGKPMLILEIVVDGRYMPPDGVQRGNKIPANTSGISD